MTEPTRAGTPPVILSVDDDEQVVEAVATDLRARYGSRYRIVAATSGQEALTVVERLSRRGDLVAVVVADQRMPGINGTSLLREAKRLQPHLRSVLLTAYADTDAAIEAINEVALDHYIIKPWDPPEQHLYPVLDELLEHWQATRPRPDPAIRMVGDRWSAASHALRQYLARNQLPFRWIDLDHPDAAPLLAAAGDDARLPLLLIDDGRVLSDATRQEVATALGLAARPEVDFHDLVVVGGGPAGLAAAVYGASEGLSTLVVEAEAPGGQAALSALIENYLGFPSGVTGSELARRALAQVRRFGASVVAPNRAVSIRSDGPYRIVSLDDGTDLHCGAVILAMGVEYRRLEAAGIDDLTGAGVYYGAASTEASAMADLRVVVVGGANSAGQAALDLARSAKEVIVSVRGAELARRMSRYLVDRIEATANILVKPTTEVASVRGGTRLEQVELRHADGTSELLDAAGMFIFIGARPRTDWLADTVVTDRDGFVMTGSALRPDRWSLDRDPFLLETSVPGVFAVGDVRATSVKRVASAVGEGSVAVQFVHEVLRGG
ncbi:FAD-dependent oxidoreductase [Nitriliruptor alkaliphilus]|uniref:FAD-dependent oxidoreductase n=1 Tax=Nitriliruptor alkaliphilus TaxID=427918 RepID=UPI0006976C48|nr:FAD-dependent oxidoreductase [Nitriliruptor alkaliphilus]